MISPLRYPGGKVKLYRYFVELIRLNNLYNCTYSEPYAGGAGLALKLLSHGFVSKIEINDIDPAIFSFWRTIIQQPDDFCKAIEAIDISIEEWRNQREIYRAGLEVGEFALGFAAYYLNRTSRSGIIEGSGPIGGYAQAGNWKIDARFNKEAQIDQIQRISCLAHCITVTNYDALDFCRDRINFDGLIYLDPPYYLKGSKLYKNYYRHGDHRDIADFLMKNKDSNWVLSYDYADQIIELYGDFEPVVYELPYSAGATASGSEVIFAGTALQMPDTRFLPQAA